MQYAVYGYGGNRTSRANIVLDGDEYEYLFGDREFSRERYVEITKERGGLVFTAAERGARPDPRRRASGVWKLARASKVEHRMSLQVGREPLGLELRPGGLTQVATRRTQVGGRPALRLNSLLEPKRELRPRRRILLSEIVAAQRLLNLMVEQRQGRLEVGEDGRLKVFPIHGGRSAKAGSEGA